jgi:molybdopterin-synthase adenylyltransferase
MIDYATLTLRNGGYIAPEIQRRIRDCRLLVAGCGIGSAIAEAAARIGFERITLVDGDTVEAHNLNRQNYVAADVGRKKVDALAARLRAINPAGDFRAVDAWVTLENADELVGEADLIVETIDLLDLGAIVALHDAAAAQRKPIVTAASAGWGAVAVYFPPGTPCTFRELFGVAPGEDVAGLSYTERFATFFDRLGRVFAPEVQAAMRDAVAKMQDDVPCPASHIIAGAFAVGSLCTTIAVRHLAGLPCDAAPKMVTVDMASACVTSIADLRP